jgi:FMN reductase
VSAKPSSPRIVGIGGTTKLGSSTEHALTIALAAATAGGAEVQRFDGPFLARLPHYGTDEAQGSAEGRELIAAVRLADGVIIASPGYHGSISGLVKNAIDYLEETARDERVYLDGVPVGLIVTAYGWQATGSTLSTMRSIVHSLRGWPTPLGATVNSSGGIFKEGVCTDAAAAKQLELVGQQVVEFARLRRINPEITETGGPE